MWASLSSPFILRTLVLTEWARWSSVCRRHAGALVASSNVRTLQARDDLLSVGAKSSVTPHHILYAPDGA